MRKDMAKVIVERPRSNSGDRASDLKGVSRRRYQLTGKLKRGWRGGGTKEFNDLTSPLKGYLRKQVGRPWNDVWSDVCAVSDNRDVVNKHLRQHVRGYVSINNYRNGLPAGEEFYVDDAGILRLTPPNSRWWIRTLGGEPKPKPKGKQWVHLSPTSQLQMLSGIWYLITVGPIPPVPTEHFNYAMKRKEIKYEPPMRAANDARELYGRVVLVLNKKQLSKREMKAYGVRTNVLASKPSQGGV